jgi:hypothetical protein
MQQPQQLLRSLATLALFGLMAAATFGQSRDFHTQRVVLDDNNGNKIMIQTPPGPITGGILTIPDPAGLGTFLISNPSSGSQSLNGDLLPNADSLFNLGSMTYRWRNLFVGENILTSSLLVYGTVDLRGAISSSTGVVTVNDDITITGTTELQGYVRNSNGTVTLADQVEISDNLGVGGGKVLVNASNGNITTTGAVDVTGASIVRNTLDVHGMVTAASGLTSHGPVTALTTLTVSDTLRANAPGNIIGNGNDAEQLQVIGVDGGAVEVDINGDVDISGSLTTGSLSMGGATLTGNLDIGPGKFTVDAATGNTVVAGATNLHGLISNSTDFLYLDDTTVIVGPSYLQAPIQSSAGNLIFNDQVDISGAVTASAAGNIIGDSSDAEQLRVDGINGGATEFTVNGDATVTGSLTAGSMTMNGATLTGNLNIGPNKFIVEASTGNTVVAGTIDLQGTISSSTTGSTQFGSNVMVFGDFGVSGARFTVEADSGNFAADGIGDVRGSLSNSSGNLRLNDNVDISGVLTSTATGNVIGDSSDGMQLRVDGIDGGAVDARVNGDLDVTGTLTAGSFSSGTLGLTGDLNIGPGNFTVAAASGNTVVAGTTDLQGNVSNSLTDLTINDNLIVTGTSDLQGAVSSTTGNLSLNDDVDISGNVTIQGTVSSGPSGLILNDDVDISSTLDLGGDLNIGVGNFTVAAGSGNTVVAGTSELRGAISNGSGALNFADDIVVTGTTDLQDEVSSSTGNLKLQDDVDVSGNFDVGAGNFTVASTGNTVVGATLDVNGAFAAHTSGNTIGDTTNTMQLQINGVDGGAAELDVNGDLDLSGSFIVGDSSDFQGAISNSNSDLLLADDVDITGTLDLSNNLSVAGNFTVDASNGNTVVSGNTDIAGVVAVGGGTVPTNSRLMVNNGHWTSLQGSTPTAAAAGANVTSAALANETDVAGTIDITTSGSPASGAQATVTFDAAYATAPIVVLTPANAAAAGEQVYVTRTTSGFTVNFVGTPTASTSHEFYYQVIETQ